MVLIYNILLELMALRESGKEPYQEDRQFRDKGPLEEREWVVVLRFTETFTR